MAIYLARKKMFSMNFHFFLYTLKLYYWIFVVLVFFFFEVKVWIRSTILNLFLNISKKKNFCFNSHCILNKFIWINVLLLKMKIFFCLQSVNTCVPTRYSHILHTHAHTNIYIQFSCPCCFFFVFSIHWWIDMNKINILLMAAWMITEYYVFD